MGLESLEFSGLWEYIVEIKSTRLRELPPFGLSDKSYALLRRNEAYPTKGIVTIIELQMQNLSLFVEMKLPRLRELPLKQ